MSDSEGSDDEVLGIYSCGNPLPKILVRVFTFLLLFRQRKVENENEFELLKQTEEGML